MISELIATRSKYNDVFFELQTQRQLVAALQREKEAIVDVLKKKDSDITSQNYQIRKFADELNKLKQDFEFIKTQLENGNIQIANLKQDNQKLKAHASQLQHGVSASQNFEAAKRLRGNLEEPKVLENEYEVESLLGHKIVKGQRYFRVHWKNYDSGYDTWEPERNLKCQTILQQYLGSKKRK